MKRIITLIASAVFCTVAGAQTIAGVNVEKFKFDRSDDYMVVEMIMDISKVDVKSTGAVVITPRIVGANDSIELKSVGIYGRRRYFSNLRNGINGVTGKEEMSYRDSDNPGKITYNSFVPYEEWMNGAVLKLHRSDCGCCNTVLSQEDNNIALYEKAAPYIPVLVYAVPVAEKVKSRTLEGSAFVDFVVDKTDIRPEYRNNVVELAKIRATIDSVRNDKDVTITNIWLKGYASPESPYAHNTDLAKGRTKAVKDYVQGYYKFAPEIFSTDYEPENWAGLRAFVEKSDLEHRAEILDIIDSDMKPDPKEWKIKSTYKEEYQYLLKTCYPALRRTDYRVAYTISEYSDPKDILSIFNTRPQNLSLNEFYILSQMYEPGSREFLEVFETAVRMYPNDEVANLNAANAAISIGNLAAAEKYLAKAGNGAQAVYARGIYAFHRGEFEQACKYLQQAKDMGVAEAAEVLNAVSGLKK